MARPSIRYCAVDFFVCCFNLVYSVALIYFKGSNVATCEPLSISFARTPLRNCTHMIEIPLPFNNDGKKVVREVIRQVASIPDARLEEQLRALCLLIASVDFFLFSLNASL